MDSKEATPEYWKSRSLVDFDGEIWKDIPGYEGLYQASSLGRVKRLETVHVFSNRVCVYPEKVAKQGITDDGYLSVGLTRDKKTRVRGSHIFICSAFHKNPENKPQVNHKDGVKTCNCEWNLEWNTNQENAIHAFEVLGRQGSHVGKFNELHHRSKKVLCVTNGITYPSQHEAQRQLGCPQSNITAVCHGRKSHVKGYVFKFI